MVWWTAAFRWTDKPRLAIFAELLIDCEEDRTLRGRCSSACSAGPSGRHWWREDRTPCRRSGVPEGCCYRMSETAQFGPAGMEVHEASPHVVAFEAFFEQEGDGLYRSLWLVTRNQFEAEELTQEAFVRVLERWDRVSEMEDPRAYLYRTAMNAFRTGYGRALLAAKRTMKVLPSDDTIAEIDERDAAVRALARLSPRQRAAVVLTDMLGFGSEEAARMLGIRASTLRMHASRAHAALKETMSRD
jgi:RNA polymerase sigma-70 factor (ECF subfamily)